MSTAAPPRPPSNGALTPVGRLLLFVGLPVLILAIIAAGVLAALPLLRGHPVNLDYHAAAGATVRVDVPNARFDIRPASDSQVHVAVTGTYTGQEPAFAVETVGGETTVRGGCRPQWLSRCDLEVALTLPSASGLALVGDNGAIRVTGLTGGADLRTTNGLVDLDGLSGDVRVATTNGEIRARGMTSSRVEARTTNGTIDLGFAAAPAAVGARTTNGAVVVRVPDDGTDYVVDARTTNGVVRTDTVPSVATAVNSITAEATNGDVTVTRR